MYNGDERLINDGTYMSYTMLDFWRWAYSNVLHNMQRGTLADFIVRCALDRGGVITRSEIGTGLEPYDLEGPLIPSTGKISRIEVKSAAFVQLWDIKHPDRANFSIAPATMPDETGDYPEGAVRQRNNDLYVFTLYTATDRRSNILDLSWWQFFVLPTYIIEANEQLRTQKTISLKKVRQLCPALSFDMLCNAIIEACNSIPAEYAIHIFPPKSSKPSTPPPRKIGGGLTTINFLFVGVHTNTPVLSGVFRCQEKNYGILAGGLVAFRLVTILPYMDCTFKGHLCTSIGHFYTFMGTLCTLIGHFYTPIGHSCTFSKVFGAF